MKLSGARESLRAVVAVLALAVAAAAGAPPTGAEPAVVPQPGASCPESFAEAYTQLPDAQEVVVCQPGSGGQTWLPVGQPFDPSDIWLSYGPGLTLHGQGRRNPELLSGQWTATPQDGGACGVEQAAVTDAGVGEPQATAGEPAQTLAFEEVPVVYSITLTGYCLWERVD